MQIKKIIQSFNPRYRKDKKALANLARMANESYQEMCDPESKSEYQKNAERFRDRIKATILAPRFLSLSKSMQKNNLLTLLDDQASIFFEPLIFEFTRALDGIYTPEELKTFSEQIKEPEGLYKTFRSGMVEIDGTKKLPQVALFLKSSGSPYLEALAEILHSLRLIDADTNPIEDRATKTGFKVIAGGRNGGSIKKKSDVPESLSLIRYDGDKDELLRFFEIFHEARIIELPSNFNVAQFFGEGRVMGSQYKTRGKITVRWRGLYGLISFLRIMDSRFCTNLWTNGQNRQIRGSVIKAAFDYVGKDNTVWSVNPGSLTTYKTDKKKLDKISTIFRELQEVYLHALRDPYTE